MGKKTLKPQKFKIIKYPLEPRICSMSYSVMCINVVGSEGGDKKPREWADVNNGSGVSSKL